MHGTRRKAKLLDVVALAVDIPSAKLVRGQVGTIVEKLKPGVYEVEFCDSDGRTYATCAVRADQIIVLHYDPVAA